MKKSYLFVRVCGFVAKSLNLQFEIFYHYDMSRLSAFCLIILGLAAGMTSCNSDGVTLEYEMPSSAIVKSFSLTDDTNVLDNLDNVFFSIDLVNGKIFNADSMPYGTNVTRLIPVITTGGASAIELVVPRPNQGDTTYNYVTNSTDSIDFSNGPVTLKVVSIDESVTMSYSISVNVHQVKSDSLAWGDTAHSTLPTTLGSVVAQHTVKFKGKAYCLTSDGQNYCMSVSDNPATNVWSNRSVSFDFEADVNTLRASSNALYILAENGDMYKSADEGATWTATGDNFECLIGGYGENVLGTVREDNVWKIVNTDGSAVEAPEGFPVHGTSAPVEYAFPMSSSTQLTVVGGKMTDGKLSGYAWGYDGESWVRLSKEPLPEGLEGVTVTPYYTFEENSYWVATKESIFVLLGGRNVDGVCNTTTYISYNYGMSWQLAPDLLQLPKDVPALYNAQTLVFSSLMGSRASTAITSWECPYIYMFGGNKSDGAVSNTVWRGVINRLMFKPLQ